jgi:hypothetical protein
MTAAARRAIAENLRTDEMNGMAGELLEPMNALGNE